MTGLLTTDHSQLSEAILCFSLLSPEKTDTTQEKIKEEMQGRLGIF